ncbi:dirigent protein 16-like [Malania oleifera]|uniref:dirigent protein 16-like n=1 Tax=Malania oleifera TaxID=397392 RepID=UPI0025AEA454|nr:dirigent protein 16-like [Malania oleifera]
MEPKDNDLGSGSEETSSDGSLFVPRGLMRQFGTVTLIDDEDLYEEGSVFGSPVLLGKAQGVYVASSKDGSSHMMVMTASFAAHGELKESLRFFGVYRTDAWESHVAVIGGTGEYH